MRLSKLFFRTFKEPPAEADIVSHQLLERGGYLRKLGKGLYIYTPLMWRVIKKISAIVREELDKAGCQELCMPQLHPAEIWKESGRWEDFTSANLLYTLKDREGHEFCLGPTHEEIIVHLVSNWVTSYKQLPLNLYQIGTKFRDEIRPRFGLIRGKEFLMKDGYSFSSSREEMEKQYLLMREAYSKIFTRLGLDFVIVEAHGGKIGKGKSEEFQVKTDIGEDIVMTCGNYASNVEAAVAIPPPFTYECILKEKRRIDTPDVATIEKLSAYTGTDLRLILKTLLFKLIYGDREEFVAIGIRGDRQANEVKICSHFNALEIVPAKEEEIRRLTGSRQGFIGPLFIKLPFYADNSCAPMTNFMCATNEVDIHYAHVNWERDLPRPEFHDFLLAEEGDECPHIKGGVYHVQRGTEVGHIFNLGTLYSEKLNALFQDEKSNTRPFWMGTYGIGIGRAAAACIEQHHDEKGIVWPLSLAPFKVFITAATSNNEKQVVAAEKIYEELKQFEPLLDDREERLGVKLKDSDLVGIPYKIILGRAFTEEGKIEIESRLGEKSLLAPEEVITWAKHTLKG